MWRIIGICLGLLVFEANSFASSFKGYEPSFSDDPYPVYDCRRSGDLSNPGQFVMKDGLLKNAEFASAKTFETRTMPDEYKAKLERLTGRVEVNVTCTEGGSTIWVFVKEWREDGQMGYGVWFAAHMLDDGIKLTPMVLQDPARRGK